MCKALKIVPGTVYVFYVIEDDDADGVFKIAQSGCV